MVKTVILTNFSFIRHGYSLTGIVEDQIQMLKSRGRDVTLFVSKDFDWDTVTGGFYDCEIKAVIPAAPLKDYRSQEDFLPFGQKLLPDGRLAFLWKPGTRNEHVGLALETSRVLEEFLQGFDVVFTHDWAFTGWNLPHFLGLLKACESLPGIRFYHWVHSIPLHGFDWWRVKAYEGEHKIVFPNITDAGVAARAYHGDPGDVLVIPHIKDPRSWFGFCKQTCRIIEAVPGLMQADYVQIMPVGTDRLGHKGLDHVIRIFGRLKNRQPGRSVCLFIANSWATARGAKEAMEPYFALARRYGLDVGRDVVFSSMLDPDYEPGLPRRVVQELFLLSNLFIFPTVAESFGLVVPEAALSGSLFVGNRSLTQQLEVAGVEAGLFFDFGSYEKAPRQRDKTAFADSIASLIAGEFSRNKALINKTRARQEFNWDRIYRDFYEPLLAQADLKEMEAVLSTLLDRISVAGSRDWQRFNFVMMLAMEACPPPARVLEVGPGDGTFAAGFTQAGFSVTSFDLGAADFSQWHELGVSWMAEIQDIEKPIPENRKHSFDLVHAGQILEHLKDPDAAMMNIVDLCEPGGLIIVSVPDFTDPDHWRTYDRDGFYEWIGEYIQIRHKSVFKGKGRKCFLAAGRPKQ